MMSTGSGGSDDVEREPALFNSVKDFSMIILGLGSEANIENYRVYVIQSSVVIVSKGFEEKQKKCLVGSHSFTSL